MDVSCCKLPTRRSARLVEPHTGTAIRTTHTCPGRLYIISITPQNSSRYLQELKSTLAGEGVRAALIYMNHRTSHRFSAIFRFDHETLRSMYFYDRQNPALESTDELPVEASYCVFIRRTGNPFGVDASLTDPRVADHPKRETVQSYTGMPLLDELGVMYGTICHFDFEPATANDLSIELMEAIGPLLKRLPVE
jgi:hypothetical protein